MSTSTRTAMRSSVFKMTAWMPGIPDTPQIVFSREPITAPIAGVPIITHAPALRDSLHARWESVQQFALDLGGVLHQLLIVHHHEIRCAAPGIDEPEAQRRADPSDPR